MERESLPLLIVVIGRVRLERETERDRQSCQSGVGEQQRAGKMESLLAVGKLIRR